MICTLDDVFVFDLGGHQAVGLALHPRGSVEAGGVYGLVVADAVGVEMVGGADCRGLVELRLAGSGRQIAVTIVFADVLQGRLRLLLPLLHPRTRKLIAHHNYYPRTTN